MRAAKKLRRTAIDAYLAEHRFMIEAAVRAIDRRTDSGRTKPTLTYIAFDVGMARAAKGMSIIPEYRIRYVLSTAARMGAFRDWGIRLMPYYGFKHIARPVR